MNAETCQVCGKKSLLSEKFGNVTLCKVCSMKILSPTWKNKSYSSNEEVEDQKNKVIKFAKSSTFPKSVTEDLAKFFDDKTIEGLVKIFDGEQGQILTVYETCCIVDTTDSFDYANAEKAYRRLLVPSKRGTAPISLDALNGVIDPQMAAGVLTGVIGGVLPGGGLLAKTGKSIASSIITQQLTGGRKEGDAKAPAMLNMRFGERCINYVDYDEIDLVVPFGEEKYGFIKLQNSEDVGSSTADVLFFFGASPDSKEEAKRLYKFMKKRIREINEIRDTNISGAESAVIEQCAPAVFTADELLKFKQLLDMGAITQEEFEIKKKQLLNL